MCFDVVEHKTKKKDLCDFLESCVLMWWHIKLKPTFMWNVGLMCFSQKTHNLSQKHKMGEWRFTWYVLQTQKGWKCLLHEKCVLCVLMKNHIIDTKDIYVYCIEYVSGCERTWMVKKTSIRKTIIICRNVKTHSANKTCLWQKLKSCGTSTKHMVSKKHVTRISGSRMCLDRKVFRCLWDYVSRRSYVLRL